MPKIVISYRRADSDAIAGRIRDRLANYYGDQSVFMDIDNIPFGIDFRDHLQAAEPVPSPPPVAPATVAAAPPPPVSIPAAASAPRIGLIVAMTALASSVLSAGLVGGAVWLSGWTPIGPRSQQVSPQSGSTQ